ncbi:MAG: hypothetical protein IPG07_22000 [Crocinitomicaceae bacterium]|nr:hypothetical protein [Crocinitomicaceae bacterium]
MKQNLKLTVMRVTVKGTNDKGVEETVVYNLYDEYDPKTQTSSMARTTGYTQPQQPIYF